MKTQIDIFTGFLGSGKTSMINEMLEEYIVYEEKIVIIQCETGEEEIKDDFINNRNIIVYKLPKEKPLDNLYIKEIAEKYSPHRIIIEQNGMDSLDKLLNKLNHKGMRKYFVTNTIVNVIDCRKFHMLMGIVGDNLMTQIVYSDIVILNYGDKVTAEELKKIKRKVKIINKSGSIIDFESIGSFKEYIDEDRKEKWIKKSSDKLSLLMLTCIAIYLFLNIFKAIDLVNLNVDFSKFHILNTIFIGILIESFPFLIIGVLISSLIQIFVTRDMIVKYFPKNKVLSFLMAIVGGVFFPVCDCAIVPVVSRLVKKGVPLYAAVTFMLAAPIVNPIVIASTYYAFPGQPSIVLFRLLIGIVVAVVSGLIFLIFPENEGISIKNLDSQYNCSCIYCNGYRIDKGIKGKISVIFKHAGEEFFDVGKFLIIGALLASIFQVMIPKSILENVSNLEVTSILIMMIIAFLFSVCSSSDAFIARSFSNQFSMNSIMGFMVLGPMVDIKNLLMLSESFNKRFIVKLLFIVFNIAFSAICFFTILFF
ncbi:permease [Tissierella sp. MSJ-40]|uniref:Permease n=1 Tax=Tissierella simiarum TaxID=2841534 RepID=A0ABS6E6P9_9FIRM|nr:permease [Tissierella simiarum]MBU5438590.1 permease [Tissierella simiarum]